jgi:hypothetical protein
MYPPGNRAFTWRTDTVAGFPSMISGVWAFSDTDAYVMGSIVDWYPPYTGRFGKHWNGKVWEDSLHGTWLPDEKTGAFGDIAIAPANGITGDDHFMVCVGLCGENRKTYGGVAEFNNTTKKWKSNRFQDAEGELRAVWTDRKGYFIAVGDNGMVYTKDGYQSALVYQKAPTSFHLTAVSGCSKNEIYVRGYTALVTGYHYNQYWKYTGTQWIKLLDNQDTTGTIVKLEGTENSMYSLAAYRCPVTDSLKLYLIGWESFLLEAKGQDLHYKITNLSTLGLPLRAMWRTGLRISFFTPNDFWVFGTRYNFFHWNGSNFQQMLVPGIPYNDLDFGDQPSMMKLPSGKVFLASEVSSQVYVVAQGTP